MLKLVSINARMTLQDAVALQKITDQEQARSTSETVRRLIQAEAMRRNLWPAKNEVTAGAGESTAKSTPSQPTETPKEALK